MILFTGTGAIASTFKKYYSCKIVSARFLSDLELEDLILKSSTIIHNAAVISSENLSTYIESNFILTKRILDIAFRVNPEIRFINISSMSILKTANHYLRLSEMSNYAISKYFAELYCDNHPIINLSNVRFSTIFYKDPSRDGLSKLVYDGVKNKKIAIYNNGESERDFIPINIAVKYLFQLTNQTQLPRRINIATGIPLSFKYFVDRLLKRNSNIKIENINTQINDVLHSFDLKEMEKLKKINFDLDYEFDNYVENIYALSDL